VIQKTLCKSQVEFHFHVLRGTGDKRKLYEGALVANVHVHWYKLLKT